MLYRLFDQAGIIRTKIGVRYDKAAFNGFHKRFNTILKIDGDINSNIAREDAQNHSIDQFQTICNI
jgi:hypothetical protein